jgi:NitT/TauT family transport system permease protein
MGKIQKLFWQAFIILLFFSVWELISRLRLVNPAFVPPFSSVLRNMFRMFVQRDLARHTGLSLYRALTAVFLASLAGVPLGFILAGAGAYEKLRAALGPFTEFLAQINPFVLFHVLILFLGIGEAAKIVILFWACLWPITFNTTAGVESINRTILKAGRGFGGHKIDLFIKVMLPAAFPKIGAGIRTAAGYALFMLIAAEMMGGVSGLGWLTANEQIYFRIENMYSITLVVAALGILVDGLLRLAQKLIVPWHLGEYMNSVES